ncbi:MAG: hypothetical protein RIT47_1127, partial [Pseudomonadota bacterium]
IPKNISLLFEQLSIADIIVGINSGSL